MPDTPVLQEEFEQHLENLRRNAQPMHCKYEPLISLPVNNSASNFAGPAFGQPAEQQPGCGFPVAHLLALLHAGTGLLTHLVVAPLHTHDLARVREVHSALQAGDVLVADRGLCASAHLALLTQAGLYALLRVQARQMVDFTPARPFVMPGTRRTNRARGSFAPVSTFADLMCYPALREAIMWGSGRMMLRCTIDHALVLKDFRWPNTVDICAH
jgi:hypothetical protein